MEIRADKFLALTALLAGFVPTIACTTDLGAPASATHGEGNGDVAAPPADAPTSDAICSPELERFGCGAGGDATAE